MKANKNYIMAVTTKLEAGYVNNPNDKGGPTNHGVTIATLSAYRGRRCTISDVKALTKAEAIDILGKGYYDKVWGDQLPDGIDLSMTDWAINSGPSVPIKAAQKRVGVAADGIMGPLTLAAIQRQDTYTLNKQINEDRMAFFKSLGDFKHFGRGWTIRVTGKDPKGQWKDAPGIVSMSNDLIRKRPLVLVNPPDVVLDAGKASPASAKVTAGKTGKIITTAAVGSSVAFGLEWIPSIISGVATYGPQVIDFAQNAPDLANKLRPLAIFFPQLGLVIQGLTLIGSVGAMFVNRARERQTGFDYSQ